jgi:hypothetical protein
LHDFSLHLWAQPRLIGAITPRFSKISHLLDQLLLILHFCDVPRNSAIMLVSFYQYLRQNEERKVNSSYKLGF